MTCGPSADELHRLQQQHIDIGTPSEVCRGGRGDNHLESWSFSQLRSKGALDGTAVYAPTQAVSPPGK